MAQSKGQIAQRILVVSQFFAPESAAPAARFHDLGKRWVAQGRQVTVLTGLPNFPSGRVHEGYRDMLFGRENLDGIEVLRSWLFTSPQGGALRKGAGYLSWAASASARAAWAGLLAQIRPDVVIATLPPPTVGLPALVAAGLARAPLVVDLRDIWPEAVVASGKLSSPLITHSLEGLARTLYRTATAVVVVSEGKQRRMAELGVPQAKLATIPNGIDLGVAENLQPVDELWRSWGVDPGDFKILYAGIHNPPQGLDVLLDAATQLRDQRPDLWSKLRLVLVGSGAVKEQLRQRAQQSGLDRVVFAPEQPRAVIPSLLASAHCSVVPLKKRKDTHTVPSKIFESLGSGRPLVASLEGEAAEIARASGGALVTPPEDGAALAAALGQLIDDPVRAAAMGSAGKAFVVQHYSRDRLAQRFLDVLDAAVQGKGPP